MSTSNNYWKVDNFFKHTSISQVPRRFNDCYYYCYSQCTKPSCEFRHEPASLRCEIICPEWLQGNCMDLYCPLRHMYLLTDRSQIDCWWEDKPGGCTRPNCAYRHKEDRIRLNIPEKAAENAAPCEVAAEVQVLDNGNDVQDLQQSYHEPENEIQYLQPCFLEPPNEALYVQICYSEPQHDDLYLQPTHEESSGDSVESPKDMPVSPVDQLITAISAIEISDTQHGDGDMLVPQ